MLLTEDDPESRGVAVAAASWLAESGKIPKDCGCVISYDGPDRETVKATLLARCGTPVASEDITRQAPDFSRWRQVTIGPIARGHHQDAVVRVVIEKLFGGSRYAAILAFQQGRHDWQLVARRSVIPQ